MSFQNSFTIATAAIFGSLGLLWLYRKLRGQQQMAQLRDKVVVITGASSGVGEACAHAFYRLGCKVILCARRVAELERVKSDLLSLKLSTSAHSPRILPLDLERLEELPAKAKDALSVHGHVDILINNGGFSVRGSALETVLSVHQKLMNVNHFGSVALTTALLPNMIDRKCGHIVAVSSVLGKIAIPFRTAYSASKHAMQAFFDTLRSEVTQHNVHVSVISPSYIKTNLSMNALKGDGSAHAKMDSTIATGMSTDYVARRIVEAVARQQNDVVMGPITHRVAIYLRTLLPNVYMWIVAMRALKGATGEA